MKIRNVTQQQLSTALTMLNKEFNGNIIFSKAQKKGRVFIVRLAVKNTREKGSRIGLSGRRLKNACWHAHGKFFESLFKVNPDAIVLALNRKITATEGNWKDIKVGSLINPYYLSELCNCN